MCGICGFIGAGGQTRLDPMIQTLVHRGPDEAGKWIGDGVALGMRRLAIIDVETGHQPIFNEDETICVVFNGEIYNFLELRQELLSQGHRFRTDHSDTEVIVHLYEQYGESFVDRLNGMFAIAIWDKTRDRLLLVRDRVGIKPLYYASVRRELIFGSEPKALLAHPSVSRTVDPIALHHYFTLKNIPAPYSAFQEIKQLRPGEMLVWENGKIQLNRWWRLSFRQTSILPEEEIASRIYTLLEDSVRLQMRSDVPVGAYLSGGVDSSSVVALMSRLGTRNIKTFTLVYEDGIAQKEADRHFAREVAKRYATDHHECLVNFRDVPEKLPAILSAFDEPFSGVISTYFLTELISKHVKVALSGDGADELFGSYLPHRLAQPLAIAAADPNFLDKSNETLQNSGFADQRVRLKRILARGDEAARRMEQYLADEREKRSIYSPAMRAAIGEANTESDIRAIYGECDTSDPLNRALFVDFETLLPDQVLAFSDRLSMAHSVEVRPPFLDHRLVEFAASLPGSMKINGQRVKSILKEAVAKLLPEGIVDRPKEGFVMPINDWLLQQLRPFVQSQLSSGNLARHGLLDAEEVNQLLIRYYSGEKALASRIWNLVSFQIWWEKYVG